MRHTKKSVIWFVAVLSVLALTVSDASAQTTGTQTYTLTVDPVLTITAPAAATLTHNATDANQVFTAQQWSVSQNNGTGANVTFSTNQAFTNGTVKRNAKLDLAIASSEAGAAWALTTATDQTAYAATTPDEVATVAANATGPGNATFGLTVTFIDTDYSLLKSGSYSTTITGTIAANP